MSRLQTMKISELVAFLNAEKKRLGDVPVFHQRDPEGNGYGTLNPQNIFYADKTDTKIGKALFIAPFDEGIEDDLYDSIF